ncbi:MAG: FGGY-family carbohydrate kinase [Pseudomonadota bacterium]
MEKQEDSGAGILAIDLGGSALKACLFQGDAAITSRVPLVFEEDASGRSEQAPEIWWQALKVAAAELAEAAPDGLAALKGIGLCGFTRTQVVLDKTGQPLRPALGFRDTRAQAVVEAASGLNAYHPLARLLWLKQREPAVWAATRSLLEPKDYLTFRLTGQAFSDPISQHWLLEAQRSGLAADLDLEPLPLPRLAAPTARVGLVRPELPGVLSQLAGLPVFCGSNDTWTAAAGLGALAPGRAYCISGSSEVLGLMTATAAEAPGLLTLPWGDDLWHIGGPGLNGAETLQWIVDLLDPRKLSFDLRLSALLAAPAAPQPLLFHPFLRGERTPYWNQDLRASFLGLSAAHGPGDLVRAVMEGIAFLNRTVLERAEAASGTRAEALRIAGGGASSAAWNQIRAAILERPLLSAGTAEMGLAGCWAVAQVGLGLAPSLAGAAAARLQRVEPNAASKARYTALYSLFFAMQEPLASASERLVAIGQAHPPADLEQDPA